MKFIIFMIFALSSMGCATYSTSLQGPDGKNADDITIDSRACTIITNFVQGQAIRDENYFVSCMHKKGYTSQTREGTDYILFTTWK